MTRCAYPKCSLAKGHEGRHRALAVAQTDAPVGPVRFRSANCVAGDHDECASMVEQDVVELGITDCLCDCHADVAADWNDWHTEQERQTGTAPDTVTGNDRWGAGGDPAALEGNEGWFEGRAARPEYLNPSQMRTVLESVLLGRRFAGGLSESVIDEVMDRLTNVQEADR